MGVVLARQVLSKQHRYDELEVDSGISSRAVRLPGEVFQASGKSESWIGQVVSTAPKPGWYSPAVSNHNQQQADLEVIKIAASTQSWSALSTMWLGCLCQRKHRILIHRLGTDKWYFAGHHWPDSAVLAWPALHGFMPGPVGPSRHQFFEPDLQVQAPELLSVSCLKDWEAISYLWRSPAWQYAHYPAAHLSMQPAVRAFPKHGHEGFSSKH